MQHESPRRTAAAPPRPRSGHPLDLDDVRVARLDPAARSPPDLSWEGGEADRDRLWRQRARGGRVRSAFSGMSIWNGQISVAVSTVAMPTSRSSDDPSIVEGRRTTATRGEFRRGRSHYGVAANDPTTVSESALRVNAIHHIRTNTASRWSCSSTLVRRTRGYSIARKDADKVGVDVA
jgi:hypothetical protein